MKRFHFITLTLLILLSIYPPKSAQAAAGAPGSSDFGYGAWLHLDGKYLQDGLTLSGELQLDWIAVHFDWSRWTPQAGQISDFSTLDEVMQQAADSHSAVMISLSNPPAWALTAQGPSTEATAQLVTTLAGRYPGVLQAVEIFPAANTTGGWNAAPDPASYSRLYRDVKSSLEAQGLDLLLVAAGLSPLDPSHAANDWQDVDFLRGLYAAGASQWMEVISLHFPQLTGSPLDSPSGDKPVVLRHYEAIRQVMLENDHQSGLIWITQLSVPDGTIDYGDRLYRDPQRQAEWLQQAIIQARSQLYIGVVFLLNINPPLATTPSFGSCSLVQKPKSVHTFYAVLKAIIQQARPGIPQNDSGRPKGSSLLKCKYKT